jgi:hypothetical protein
VSRPHLFVDISSHGFGHLAQVAPVLNALVARLPTLRLTVRSGLPSERLRARLRADFTHLAAASDFGYRMLDALCVDLPATAAAYRALHADWPARVAAEAAFLGAQQADLVLGDVAYLPLAGAAQAGIPSLAMSSLNWADLLAHFFAGEAWAAPIHRQMLAAYNSAECFLRLTPGMPMADLHRRREVGPVAARGKDCRAAVRARLGCPADERLVLIAFGGFSKRLPMESWPPLPGVRWLVHEAWQLAQANATAFETLGYAFPDLLRAVDAVLTKPGYGTFAETACNGTPVLYVRRHDWPEQDCLIDWLGVHGRCRAISDAALAAGDVAPALDALWQQPVPPAPAPVGAAEAAAVLLHWLTAGNRNF